MEYNGIELEQIKEKIIVPDGRDMLVWDDNTTPTIKKVYAIINRGEYDYNVITKTNEYQYAAEIPKTQMRERTVVEKVKYLQRIESELKDDEILVGNHLNTNDWVVDVGIITHRLYENRYEFAIYKSEDDIEIIEIPETEV